MRHNVCVTYSKILELEEELKVVGNNMKSLEISEQEVIEIATTPRILKVHTSDIGL